MNRLHVAITVLGILGIATFIPVTTSSHVSHAADLAKGVDMVQGVVMTAGNSQLMIIPDAGDIAEFIVAPNARITKDGEVTQLEGLQARDHVIVMCTGVGPERTAVDIVARSPL